MVAKTVRRKSLKSFRCSICNRPAPKELLTAKNFPKRMQWLWGHRKKNHPKAFKQSVQKSQQTRKANITGGSR